MAMRAPSQLAEPPDNGVQVWKSRQASFSSISDALNRLIHIAPLVRKDEHAALLVHSAAKFNLLRRKDDLFDDGVAAIFGIAGGEAELLGCCFDAESFTTAEATTWLTERRFATQLFVTNSGETCRGQT